AAGQGVAGLLLVGLGKEFAQIGEDEALAAKGGRETHWKNEPQSHRDHRDKIHREFSVYLVSVVSVTLWFVRSTRRQSLPTTSAWLAPRSGSPCAGRLSRSR